MARSWRVREGLVDLQITVEPRWRASGDGGLGFRLRALVFEAKHRPGSQLERTLVAIHEELLRPAPSGSSYWRQDTGGRLRTLERIEGDLLHALSAGALHVREDRPRPVVPAEAFREEALGPADPGPPDPGPDIAETYWVDVALFDSTGAAMAAQPCVLAAPGAAPGGRLPLDGNGRIRRTDLPAGACSVTFPTLDDRPPGVVPADAPPFAAVDGAVLLTRRRDAQATQSVRLAAMPASAGYSQAFQLARRVATVVELEHFFVQSAVFLPGPAPSTVELRDGAARVRGIDALKACLDTLAGTPLDQIRITGHDSDLSQARADNVRALVVGDAASRDAWVAGALRRSRIADQQLVLQWAAQQFGWGCDPGPITNADSAATHAAIRAFQFSYNADVCAGLFPDPCPGTPIGVDGFIGKETWGAVFDCYMRALRPVAASAGGGGGTPAYIIVDNKHQTYPVQLAQIAAPGRDARHWTDLNPLNPDMVIPNGGGWYPPQVGQRIYIPASWSLQALADAGYETHPAEDPPKPPVVAPGAPALASPGPVAIGCGAHHLQTPFADAPSRRAVRRHVEVLAFAAGEAPVIVRCGEGDGPCPAAQCELYDPRDYRFDYVDVAAAEALDQGTWWVTQVPAWASGPVALVVLDPSGSEVARFPIAAAQKLDEDFFAFDLSSLDPLGSYRLELRQDATCLVPPVQIGVHALVSFLGSGAQETPTAGHFTFANLLRPAA
jgi:hypothetical protein